MEVARTRIQPHAGWRSTPLIAGSMLLHAVALGFLLLQPEGWPIVVVAVAGNHLLLAVVGLLPRSGLIGPNLSRLPAAAARRGEIALTIDDGPDPVVTPLVLDILDRHAAKATFFCVGDYASRHPDVCAEIFRRGHTVENHGQSHALLFAAFGPRRIGEDIDRGQAALQSVTGEVPRFFRPTAGLRSVLLDPVLARRGLTLVSWTRRGFDTRTRCPRRVLERLSRGLAAGDILLLHDGNAARTAGGNPVIVEVLPQLLARIEAAGLKPVTLRAALR